jgi:Diacylglycerol acyltransferase
MQSPQRGGRKWMWVRNLSVWRLFRDYFPARLVKTVDLDPNQKYLFGYHPHGIISVGAFLNFATEATGFSSQFPGVDLRLLTLKMNFIFPFMREYWLAYGICDVSRESIRVGGVMCGVRVSSSRAYRYVWVCMCVCIYNTYVYVCVCVYMCV